MWSGRLHGKHGEVNNVVNREAVRNVEKIEGSNVGEQNGK